jgi:hypothetical protein
MDLNIVASRYTSSKPVAKGRAAARMAGRWSSPWIRPGCQKRRHTPTDVIRPRPGLPEKSFREILGVENLRSRSRNQFLGTDFLLPIEKYTRWGCILDRFRCHKPSPLPFCGTHSAC